MSLCYLDITIGDEAVGRVILELFEDKTPKTCENFRKLCTGNDGKNVPDTETPMTYAGSGFHRVIKEFMIQGGDYTNHNGTGGYSIYGNMFEDENFDVPCDKAGLLCMANRGKDTNGSQFFITCAPATHLSGKHVVFGRVVRGMSIVRQIEHTEKGENDKPKLPCVIKACGTLTADELASDPKNRIANDDGFEDYPQDAHPPLNDEAMAEAAEKIRQAGNKAFGSQEFGAAVVKYEKALRYLGAVVTNTATHQSIQDKKVACFSNSALCFLKLQKWSAARKAADNALAIDANNTKALFRRAQSYQGMQSYDEAIADFEACRKLDPENNDVATQLQFCKDQRKAQEAKLAGNLRKMFA